MRSSLFAIVAAAIVLAGCESAPPVAETPHAHGMAQGIDMPGDARDVSLELKGSRLDFVARYYRSPQSRWPPLTAAEARTLSATGLRLVAVWESHSHRADYFSYASGYADAMEAYRQARRVGQPDGSAIYFAVDYNAPDADVRGSIDRYFRGIYAGLYAAAGGASSYRIGVYGSGAVCDYLKRMRLAQYAWLSNSTAWFGYDRFSDWNIRQNRGSAALSFGHDTNEARGEYGGFLVTSQMSAR